METENNEESLYLTCDCSNHGFQLKKSTSCGWFYLSCWKYGRNCNILSWKERCRWIWNIVITGNPWADDVIINNKQAKQIIEYINKHLPKE